MHSGPSFDTTGFTCKTRGFPGRPGLEPGPLPYQRSKSISDAFCYVGESGLFTVISVIWAL